MELNKIAGIIFFIIGLIFIIFPMFSAGLVSLIVGVSLLFFGIASIINAFSTWNMMNYFTKVNLIMGIIAIILAIIFIFFIDVFSFLTGISFYIVGFIMMVFGVVGLISKSRLSKTTSLIILLIGIIAIALAIFAVAEPQYVAMLIGLCLMIEGARLFIDD